MHNCANSKYYSCLIFMSTINLASIIIAIISSFGPSEFIFGINFSLLIFKSRSLCLGKKVVYGHDHPSYFFFTCLINLHGDPFTLHIARCRNDHRHKFLKFPGNYFALPQFDCFPGRQSPQFIMS